MGGKIQKDPALQRSATCPLSSPVSDDEARPAKLSDRTIYQKHYDRLGLNAMRPGLHMLGQAWLIPLLGACG